MSKSICPISKLARVGAVNMPHLPRKVIGVLENFVKLGKVAEDDIAVDYEE